MSIKTNYNHTLYASYIGYITQAIINNFAPLLFLTFQQSFSLTLGQISFLVTANFGVQLLVDLLAAHFADYIGYRICIVTAHGFCMVGLIGLAVFPYLFPIPYVGLLIAIALYGIGGGLIEVLISPIVEACPTDKKAAAMSLLHSFNCWGHVFVVIISIIFFTAIGIRYWPILACIWAIVPLVNLVYFTQVPIAAFQEETTGISLKDLSKQKIFWVLMLFMVCSGAVEQGMAQWASAFTESALHVPKMIGDLTGLCFFAIMMGVSRILYAKFSEKINLIHFMCISSILCIISYLMTALSPWPFLSLLGCGLCGLSIGILWPGTFSTGAKLCRQGGTGMFALLALAGDLGCSLGPAAVGIVSDIFNNDLKYGLLTMTIFPILLLIGLYTCVMDRQHKLVTIQSPNSIK